MQPATKLSAGAIELARIIAQSSAASVARKLKRDESAIRAWAKGKRTPSHDARADMLDGYGIEPDAWEAPSATGKPDPDARPGRQSGKADTRTEDPDTTVILPRQAGQQTEPALEALIVKCEELYKEACADQDVPIRDRNAVLATHSQALTRLARLRGEDSVTMDRIMSSREWTRIESALVDAVRPYPEAAQAVLDALERLQANAKA